MEFGSAYERPLFAECVPGFKAVILGGVVLCVREVNMSAVPVTTQITVPAATNDFELVAAVADKRIVVWGALISGSPDTAKASLRLKSGLTALTPWLRCGIDGTFVILRSIFPFFTAFGENLRADNPTATDALVTLNYTVE